MKVALVRTAPKAGPKAAKGAAAPVSFTLLDSQTDLCTVLGTDAAGNTSDISGVATLSPVPTSDTPAIVTVGAPTGMTFQMTAVGPLGNANITAVATWNDGSIGPFQFTLPVVVAAGPAGGIVIQPGVPTVK
jgi:hypothetical protein